MATGSIDVADKHLIVVLHSVNNPSDAEWRDYLVTCERGLASCRERGASMVAIAITDGGAPNAKQRGELAAIIQDLRLRGAVVTDRTLVRGVVTALSWINPHIRAFAPSRLRDALDHLGIPAEALEAVWQEVERLKRGLPRLATFDAAVTALYGQQKGA